jgi:glycosyltransferase A (GT-A) superfamily protein (DUF2064 family)
MVDPSDALGGHGGRTSARQAIAVLAEPSANVIAEWSAVLGDEAVTSLVRARLLDLIANLLQVDGATTVLVATDAEAAARLRLLAPPGVDLLTAPATSPERGPLQTAAWAITALLDQAFERVVVIRETAAPPPARTVATALSVLGNADLVVGPAPAGGLSLVGAKDAAGGDSLGSVGEATLAAVELAATEDGLLLRRLERQRLLTPLNGATPLAEEIERLGDLAPNVRRWLAAQPFVPTPEGS